MSRWGVEIGDTVEIHGDSVRYAGNTSERLGIGEWGLPTVYYRGKREEMVGWQLREENGSPDKMSGYVGLARFLECDLRGQR
jgi:hypothetical protein